MKSNIFKDTSTIEVPKDVVAATINFVNGEAETGFTEFGKKAFGIFCDNYNVGVGVYKFRRCKKTKGKCVRAEIKCLHEKFLYLMIPFDQVKPNQDLTLKVKKYTNCSCDSSYTIRLNISEESKVSMNNPSRAALTDPMDKFKFSSASHVSASSNFDAIHKSLMTAAQFTDPRGNKRAATDLLINSKIPKKVCALEKEMYNLKKEQLKLKDEQQKMKAVIAAFFEHNQEEDQDVEVVEDVMRGIHHESGNFSMHAEQPDIIEPLMDYTPVDSLQDEIAELRNQLAAKEREFEIKDAQKKKELDAANNMIEDLKQKIHGLAENIKKEAH